MRQFGHSTYSCVLGMVMCSFAHPCGSSVARGSSTIKRRIWRLDGPAGFLDCSQWNTLRIAWLWPRRLVIEVTLGFVIAEIDLRERFKILNFSPASTIPLRFGHPPRRSKTQQTRFLGGTSHAVRSPFCARREKLPGLMHYERAPRVRRRRSRMWRRLRWAALCRGFAPLRRR
jgi:hypothetical protein